MKFYVGKKAEAMADMLRASQGDALGDTPKSANAVEKEIPFDSRASKMDRGGIEPPTPGFSVLCSTN